MNNQKLTADLSKINKSHHQTCLFLTIFGKCKCKWMGKTEENSNMLSTHSGEEQYLNSICEIIKKDVELVEGTHSFQFQCELPRGLPSSTKERKGSIKYKIRVVIERPWRTNLKYDFDFKVIKPIDLNNYPDLFNPIRQEVTMSFQSILGKLKPFRVIGTISRTAFTVGQCALISIEIFNPTNYQVLQLKISLLKNVIYRSNLPSTEQLTECSKVREIVCGKPLSKNRLKYEVNFVIPETDLSSDSTFCRILNVSYDIRIKVVVEALREYPALKIPIKIGSVPYQCDLNL